MKTVRATLVFRSADLPPGRWPVVATAGPAGDLALLVQGEPAGSVAEDQGGPATLLYCACHLRADCIRLTTLPRTADPYTHIQPLSGGRWLLVRSRVHTIEDLNADIYSADGALLLSFHAGDGIEDVQVTSADRIWISYFDEGVFGGFGDPAWVSENGLNCFDDAGIFRFRYGWDIVAPGHAPMIADCYALNVASDTDVWCYYYTDFPLVHVKDGGVAHVWRDMPVKGSYAFAVWEDRALFQGSYEERDALYLLDLNGTPSITNKVRPVDDSSRPIAFDRTFGRGPFLFLQASGDIHRLDLREIDV